MPDDVVTDVLPESSTGTSDQTPAPGQAPSTLGNTATNGQPARTVPLESHIAERRAWQARAAEHERRATESEARLKALEAKEARGVPLTPAHEVEREVARRGALVALKELIGGDDELKSLLDLAKNSQKLTAAADGVTQLTAQQQRAQVQGAAKHVATLAKEAGLPSDPKFLTRLTRLVAIEAQGLQDGDARFDAGDISVLDEAFAAVKGDFASMRREQTAQTVATKQQLQRTVPPRPAGGASGPEAPPKLEQGKERQFWEGAMSKMRDRLRE